MNINFNSLIQFKQNYDNNNQRSYNKYPNLAPLARDNVSFGAKKNEFQGIDLLVVNKFRAPVEKFKTNDDFQKWCSKEIKKCLNKNYKGRQDETTIQRKAMLKEWSDYVLNENDAYNNAISLLILDGVTKNLKPDNDTLPPVLNKGVLADTISEIQDITKANPKAQIDFNKLYQTKLKEMYTSEITDKKEDENGNTGWIIIPSKEHDSENFDKNVEKLKALSHDTWCTKSFNAKPYLSKGDFHVYLENGKPKIGVRFLGEKIQEIQGEKNNSKIPLKYFDIVKSHIEGEKLTQNAKREIESAENTQIKIDELQRKLGKPFSECTSEELFTAFDMLEKVDDDGMLILKEYMQPDRDFSWDDLGIDENKLFKDIHGITGSADFYHSQVINLGQLQTIGGSADFYNSKVTDLGNLQTIGGDADFNGYIGNLGQLQTIGGDADFRDSKVINLGNLQTIGGVADFWSSNVANLGNLQTIGKDVYIGSSKLTKNDFDNIEIGGKII